MGCGVPNGMGYLYMGWGVSIRDGVLVYKMGVLVYDIGC